ncbi:MAG: Ig-like domain-containing protein, partial [Candidatus Kryptoniota bacterium]
MVFKHPNFFEIGRTAAAKLGRTIAQDQYWAIGYTPQRLVGVWLGKMEATSSQPELAPASMAMWYAMTQYSSQSLPAQSWETPPAIQKITVCDPSGLLPDEDCPATVNEVFLAGFEPHQSDNLFQTLPINEQTGRLATVFTPFELVKEKTFMIIPPQALAWAKSAHIAIPPTEYDVIQTTANLSSCARITSPAMFAFVHGKVKVIGSTACTGFHFYRLQLGKGLFPRKWLQIGTDVTQTVKQGELGEWDTSGLEGLYTLQLQVVGEENQVQTSLIQITVDNTPPTISIMYPTNGELISASEFPSITFQFQTYDDIAIKQVEIYLDGKNIYNLVQPPFAVPWQPNPGKHHLKVIAFDQAGN